MSASRRHFLASVITALPFLDSGAEAATSARVQEFLRNKKLTLPVAGPKGTALEISERDLQNYSDEWFQPRDSSIVFRVPAEGAATKTAKSPRTELRYLREFSINDPFTDAVNLKINKLAVNDKVIVHQIHDRNEPPLKVVARNTGKGLQLYALVKTIDEDKEEKKIPLIARFNPGAQIVSSWNYVPAQGGEGAKLILSSSEARDIVVPMNRQGKGGNMYGKTGAYAGIGNKEDCEVELIL